MMLRMVFNSILIGEFMHIPPRLIFCKNSLKTLPSAPKVPSIRISNLSFLRLSWIFIFGKINKCLYI